MHSTATTSRRSWPRSPRTRNTGPGMARSIEAAARSAGLSSLSFAGAFGAMRFDAEDRLIDETARKAALRWICRHDFTGAHGRRMSRWLRLLVGARHGTRVGWHGVDVFHFDVAGKITGKFTYARTTARSSSVGSACRSERWTAHAPFRTWAGPTSYRRFYSAVRLSTGAVTSVAVDTWNRTVVAASRTKRDVPGRPLEDQRVAGRDHRARLAEVVGAPVLAGHLELVGPGGRAGRRPRRCSRRPARTAPRCPSRSSRRAGTPWW